MRILSPPPPTVVDSATREPCVGSFRGPLPPVDLAPLGRGALYRFFRRKRWLWGAVAAEDLLLGFAVVDLGYAGSAFAWAYAPGEGRMLADGSSIGLPGSAIVGDCPEEGFVARHRGLRCRLELHRPRRATAYTLTMARPGLAVAARLDTAGAPPPVSAIAVPPGARIAVTQKRALLPVTGEATVAGRRFALGGAFAGLDYSHGYHARRTSWRWCFLLGRARDGAPVALNLVEGFVGEAECAAWSEDDLHPLAEGRFVFDAAQPLRPWRVETADGAVRLSFVPGGAHVERRNFGLVASRFVQAAGVFRGTLDLGNGRRIVIDGAPGVTEDQQMVW